MQKTFPPFSALIFKYMDDLQEVLYVRRQLRERCGLRNEKRKKPEAKFIVPDWGNQVDSDIGLSYRPARLYRQAADTATLYMSESTISPSQGLRI
jgi:hypothetical protein